MKQYKGGKVMKPKETNITEIRLTQNAWLCTDSRFNYEPYYKASATDDEDDEKYTVIWEVLPDFDPSTNIEECDACDWDKFSVLNAYGEEIGNEKNFCILL